MVVKEAQRAARGTFLIHHWFKEDNDDSHSASTLRSLQKLRFNDAGRQSCGKYLAWNFLTQILASDPIQNSNNPSGFRQSTQQTAEELMIL